MKARVVTKLCRIIFLFSILILWDDKSTLAGSVLHSKGKAMSGEMQDNSQFPKYLVVDKPGGKKGLIEIERKTGRKDTVQKQTGA